MDRCPYCANPVPPGATHCPACGSALVAPAHNLAQGTRLNRGRYTLGKVLGQGGFGITYLGADTQTRRPVAIKELFPEGSTRRASQVIPPTSLLGGGFHEARQRFIEEARTLARFDHPGIVKVYDVFEENGTAYMVMEFLRGQTLGKRIEQRGKLEPGEVEAVALKLADALEAVHGAGLLHRDIKPDNVFLTDDSRVVLIDFGSARQFALGKTMNHTRLVTPGYAPLEQYGTAGKFGPYTDIYALGATLYHALTGLTPPAATDRIQNNLAVRLPPATPDGLEHAVNRALEIRVGARPQTVAEFRALLTGRARPAPAPAPANGGLVVQVTPDSAEVELEGPNLRRRFRGDQRFGSVPPGEYRLTARAPGFHPHTVTTRVEPGRTAQAYLHLTPVSQPKPTPVPVPNPTPQPGPAPAPPQPTPVPPGPAPAPGRLARAGLALLGLLFGLLAVGALGYLLLEVRPVTLEPLLAPADAELRRVYDEYFLPYPQAFPWVRAGAYALAGVGAFGLLAFLATRRGWWAVPLGALVALAALVGNGSLEPQAGVLGAVGVGAAYLGVYLLERFTLPLAAILGLAAAVRWADSAQGEVLEPGAVAAALLILCLGGIVRAYRERSKGA